MDLQNLSKVVVAAVKKSNVGVMGLNTSDLNDNLIVTDFKTEATRSDISEDNPLIVFKNQKNKKVTIAANAIASLRVISADAPDNFDAATHLKDTKFATGLTQQSEFDFLKDVIENLDVSENGFDISKMKLTCVARLNTPSMDDSEKPAMIASAYKGTNDYYEAVAEAGNDTNAFQRARTELHESGIRSNFVGHTPQSHPKSFVWVPIFKVTMG